MSQTVARCNKKYVVKGVTDNKRIDGRACSEFRDVSIGFGLDYGSCVVSLGNSKVMSSVCWEVVEPRITKPFEGLLQINVDLSPMASPHFEFGRISNKLVEIVRIIEKSIRDSKCVDVESLCLIANEKVWSLKVDIVVLNCEGNLIECCSIAALASLCHCRRPEATVCEDKVTIHTFEEKHPLPMRIFHYPFCTSFALFNPSSTIVADPLEIEEQCSEAFVTVAANNLREITTVHMSGKSRVNKETLLKCCNWSILRSKVLSELLLKSIEEDAKERSAGLSGFASKIKTKSSVLSAVRPVKEVIIDEKEPEEMEDEEICQIDSRTKIFRFAPDIVSIGEGGEIAWDVDLDADQIPKEEANETPKVKEKPFKKSKKVKQNIDESDEEIVILEPNEFATK
ncbi:exosome complex component rrp45-like protein [Leptotrombidium deliense]|uniref:Exosome complex component RRP45 n=1 Tax=Leptotrombidium deliense TaxID=299467 RepID=A0A443SM81_9ACAR|nr:exosome complex component rrp45-like protein [Leptotrombidium deliense]